MKRILLFMCLTCLLVGSAEAAQNLIAIQTDTAPKIDGYGNDLAWKNAPILMTKDRVTNISIELQAAYTTDHVFIKAKFPDNSENREHKSLVWDKEKQLYRTSSKREDSFVIKWSMEPIPIDLSLQSELPYKADIWFWKAFRTDPMGYADDKYHIVNTQKADKSLEIITPSHKRLYLSRTSDKGKSTYKSITYDQFIDEIVPRYQHRKPEGSRADVAAKGVWSNSYWTIEFKRALETGNPDDLQFDPTIQYQFGVSRHEIAGKRPNPKLEQPYYESGDVGEELTLVFRSK